MCHFSGILLAKTPNQKTYLELSNSQIIVKEKYIEKE